MNINHKQMQIIDEVLKKAKNKFPEIVFKNIETSPDDPEHIWINVIADMDEEKEIQLIRYSGKLDNEILTKFGYKITIMPENPNFVYA